MIPSPWIALVLALGTFRITRFIGWDDFPPMARAREWLSGAKYRSRGSSEARMGLSADQLAYTIDYRWPWLDQFIRCPYCLGAWVSTGVYLGWVFWPHGTLYAVAAPALSAAVGIIARHLDP